MTTSGSCGWRPGPAPDTTLASPPTEPYIFGYLQNNPDGSFQTPLVGDGQKVPPTLQKIVQQLDAINRQFNRRKSAIPSDSLPPPAVKVAKKKMELPKEEEKSSFAGKFLDLSRKRSPDEYLGRKPQRTEEISAQQALNVERRDDPLAQPNEQMAASGSSARTVAERAPRERPAVPSPEA